MEEICQERCAAMGTYDPERDVVLWCEECRRWYHEACIDILGPLSTLLRFDKERVPELLKYQPTEPDDVWHGRWANLIALAVQRRLPHIYLRGPFSLEEIVLKARREHEERNAPPTNIGEWITREFNTTMSIHSDVDRLEAQEMLWRVVGEGPSKRMVYECPRGHVV